MWCRWTGFGFQSDAAGAQLHQHRRQPRPLVEAHQAPHAADHSGSVLILKWHFLFFYLFIYFLFIFYVEYMYMNKCLQFLKLYNSNRVACIKIEINYSKIKRLKPVNEILFLSNETFKSNNNNWLSHTKSYFLNCQPTNRFSI